MERSKKAIGAGIALAAIAAAATYFLTGRRGRENCEKIAAWTLDMKAEVLRRMKQLKLLNREAYHTVVDEAQAGIGRKENQMKASCSRRSCAR